jgi:hypothetical protein
MWWDNPMSEAAPTDVGSAPDGKVQATSNRSIAMFAITLPPDFKIGDNIDCRINKQPAQNRVPRNIKEEAMQWRK